MQSAMGLLADSKTREQASYEALRRAIIEGRWGPGEPLVGSRVAAELGVSRITVANALKRLAGEGFVRLIPHKEAVVAHLDPHEVREIYLMRAELEALAAREATRWMTPSDLHAVRALNAVLARLRAESADIRAVRAADLDFHGRVRMIARMPHLAQLLRNWADQCEGYRARLLDQMPIVVPGPERHEALLTALAQHNGEVAAACMRMHVLEGMRAVLENLDQPA